jgi:hypothetical protein
MDLQHDLPDWLKTGATLLLGAGAARLLAVWLENRRLLKKDYRDTLLGRIRELEGKIETMYGMVSKLRVDIALLDDENAELREKLGMPKREGSGDAHDEVRGSGDAGPAR